MFVLTDSMPQMLLIETMMHFTQSITLIWNRPVGIIGISLLHIVLELHLCFFLELFNMATAAQTWMILCINESAVSLHLLYNNFFNHSVKCNILAFFEELDGCVVYLD